MNGFLTKKVLAVNGLGGFWVIYQILGTQYYLMALPKDTSVHLEVRQGDPLSPFLFSLVANGLSALLSLATRANLIDGFHLHDSTISHLQFVDDTMVFLKPINVRISNLKHILHIFEIISGLKVNWEKSSVPGIHVEDSHLDSIATLMGCKVEKLLLKYLGMPLGDSPRLESFWDPVVEKSRKDLLVGKGLKFR